MVSVTKKSQVIKPTGNKKLTSRQTARKKSVSQTKKVVTPIKIVTRAGKDYIAAVGRRKSVIARVRLFSRGSGQIIINNVSPVEYFSWPEYVNTALQPLFLLGLQNTLDLKIKVTGGGKAGQAVAVRHGIARALVLLNEDYRKQLRPSGFLTRDARVKERKKPGLKRARRAPQFSKR